MSLNETASGDRIHIGFFGLRNAGKSSLVNRITNQDMSLVSEVKGTTTDAVKKSMELLPIGPVVIIDTAGIDDEGELGSMRVEATKKILKSCDIAVLVTENEKLSADEIASLIGKKGQELIDKGFENYGYYMNKDENSQFMMEKNGYNYNVTVEEKYENDDSIDSTELFSKSTIKEITESN